jgi:hypothetical protein
LEHVDTLSFGISEQIRFGVVELGEQLIGEVAGGVDDRVDMPR